MLDDAQTPSTSFASFFPFSGRDLFGEGKGFGAVFLGDGKVWVLVLRSEEGFFGGSGGQGG